MSQPTQGTAAGAAAPPSPLREIVQPFVDLVHAPRALWGINLSSLLEGMVYFGILTYLTIYFTESVGLNDVWAGIMVGVLTWGITLSMFFFGSLADKVGVRRALLGALVLMLIGRLVLASGPMLGLAKGGLGSPLNLMALFGIFFVVIGYGMYQPAIYSGVKQFTTEKTSAMGYAMIYALMNLGGWLPTFFGPLRERIGLDGMMAFYGACTLLGLGLTAVILSKKTVDRQLAEVAAQRIAEGEQPPAKAAAGAAAPKPPFSIGRWLREHPLADPKFAFFIFCLIPVQTLFAHNWLTLPKYVERAYSAADPALAGTLTGSLNAWIGKNFEAAVNFNPLLIFLLVPIVTALTRKADVYRMMILGTLVMSAPTFLLAFGTNFWLLLAFLVASTIGEAMWQPRFLQYAAEIAPEGKTGVYMGVAQFPWFLTKMITSLYAGWFLMRYVPEPGLGELRPTTMWLFHACVALSSTVMLILAKGWLGKDFKTRAAPAAGPEAG